MMSSLGNHFMQLFYATEMQRVQNDSSLSHRGRAQKMCFMQKNANAFLREHLSKDQENHG